MQDVSDAPADRARTSAGPRPERMTGERRPERVAGERDAREPMPRELLDTRLVRAELVRLRQPDRGAGGSVAGDRDGPRRAG